MPSRLEVVAIPSVVVVKTGRVGTEEEDDEVVVIVLAPDPVPVLPSSLLVSFNT